ncbi:MAG: TonB family protein [bacterium]
MSDRMNSAGYPTIGAFELKRTYQRNMIIAVLVVLSCWALCFAVAGLSGMMWPVAIADDTFESVLDIDIESILPPSVEEEPMTVETRPSEPPTFRMPEATALLAAPSETGLLEPAIYRRMASQQESGIGAPGWFAPTSVKTDTPCPLKLPLASYPEVARKAGLEGTVFLQVFVGADGLVKNVLVAIPSGLQVGFEEAAVRAAWMSRWLPAVQDGEPVGRWVRYPVRFRLIDHGESRT